MLVSRSRVALFALPLCLSSYVLLYHSNPWMALMDVVLILSVLRLLVIQVLHLMMHLILRIVYQHLLCATGSPCKSCLTRHSTEAPAVLNSLAGAHSRCVSHVVEVIIQNAACSRPYSRFSRTPVSTA